MGTAPRKQLKLKHKQLKQLKRTYKIPRSLKKSIKKNLVKIVKERERKIRDEEREKALVHHASFYSNIFGHINDIHAIWKTHQMSDGLRSALRTPLNRILYGLYSENARHEGGLSAQKGFARGLLEMQRGTEGLRDVARAWLIEEGEDAVKVEKLGKREEAQHEADNEDKELEATEEYDWTSTSTLE